MNDDVIDVNRCGGLFVNNICDVLRKDWLSSVFFAETVWCKLFSTTIEGALRVEFDEANSIKSDDGARENRFLRVSILFK